MSARRRRRNISTVISTADIATLITAIGGNAEVPSFYDTRVGVTAISTSLSKWSDARGVGFGLDLDTVSGTAPTWNAATKQISGAANGSISTASSSLHDLTSVRTIIFIGSVSSPVPDWGYVCGISDVGSTRVLGIVYNNQISVRGGGAGTFVTQISNTFGGSTIRISIASLSNTGQVVITVPNTGSAGQGSGIAAAGNNILTLGSVVSGNASEYGRYSCTAMFTMKHIPSVGESNAIRDWAIANAQAVAA